MTVRTAFGLDSCMEKVDYLWKVLYINTESNEYVIAEKLIIDDYVIDDYHVIKRLDWKIRCKWSVCGSKTSLLENAKYYKEIIFRKRSERYAKTEEEKDNKKTNSERYS